jgi:hypothetical protein
MTPTLPHHHHHHHHHHPLQRQHRWYSAASGAGELVGEVPELSKEALRLLDNLVTRHDELVAVRDDPDSMTKMNHW